MVTGGGSGIGRAIAQRLAADGFVVAVLDVNRATAEETVESINAADGSATAYSVDISKATEVSETIAEIARDLGDIEVLVNAAGIFDQNLDFMELSREVWDHILLVNVLGTATVMREVLRGMQARRSGAIVNIASSAGLVPRGGGTAYVASKYAVVGLTLKTAAEMGEYGVRVNAVAPGWIPTELFKTSAAALRSHSPGSEVPAAPQPVGGNIPMVRSGRPEEIAAGVSFLVSKESSYVTGVVLPIDGGYLVG